MKYLMTILFCSLVALNLSAMPVPATKAAMLKHVPQCQKTVEKCQRHCGASKKCLNNCAVVEGGLCIMRKSINLKAMPKAQAVQMKCFMDNCAKKTLGCAAQYSGTKNADLIKQKCGTAAIPCMIKNCASSSRASKASLAH
jgi:hypothetical protein